MEKAQQDISILAKKHKKVQTLMNYVNKQTLMEEFMKQSYITASGVDQVTKEEYGEGLENRLDDLIKRMKSFSYKPQPTRRVYIPKDGSNKQRPLGIPSFEDKLVQGCMANILNDIYETKFLDCSYGFRPKRNCHMAINEINAHIMKHKVNYILDADIKGFFDNLDHSWLMKFLENDIGDKNFLRYIVRFLRSGIIEDMKYYDSDKGTPQGGLISPVLANVYLHYVLDLWFNKVKQNYKGEMYLIRYADDFVILFQYENEAQQFYKELIERLSKFNLEIAEDKTKIIPFGRFKGTKEKFDFLGFEFHNGETLTKKYRTHIITSRKKLKVKKQVAKEWMKRNMHTPFGLLFKSLNRKLIGHYNYYGINGNYSSLVKFYKYIKYELFRILNRRHQKKTFKYNDFIRVWYYYISKPTMKVDIWNWQ